MRLALSITAATVMLLAGSIRLAAQTIQYVQDFDAVTAPALPPGWSSPEDAWETSTSVASPGSGGNNIENAGNSPGSILTPVFDFSKTTTGSITYSARRTATYDSLNLQVEASTDGGNSWTVVVVDSTASLPPAPSTYITVSVELPATVVGETAVQFRFHALHATGGNVRLDDLEILADGPVSFNRLGFSERSSSSTENDNSLVVPIGIELIPSSDGLQGLQFTVTLSPGLTFVSLVNGLAVLDSPEWHTSHEVNGPSVQVVALSEGTEGLSPVVTDSLFLLGVAVASLEGAPVRIDSLQIHDVVASSASESGEDLFLAVDPALHEVTISARAAQLTLDPTVVDIGTIAEDSTAEADLLMTNDGTGALNVLDMYSISGLVGVDPAFLTLDPNSSATVTISVAGSQFGVGTVEDWLIIEHSAPSSPDTVAIVGTVISVDTRGDANGDGSVDIVDLVMGIDLILGRISLPETEARLDLHPFPLGNETVDVRDLTVLAQAITLGMWPDGIPIPSLEAQASKLATIVGDLLIRRDLDTVGLFVRSAEPLRAIHVIGRIGRPDAVITTNSSLPMVQVGQPYRTAGAGSFSLLTFGMEDLPVSSDEPVLLATMDLPIGVDLEVVSSVAVDRSVRKRSLVSILETSDHPSETRESTLGLPYPNPVDPRTSALVHFPLTLANSGVLQILVTDVLGRTVRRFESGFDRGARVAAWDLKNVQGLVVPSGLYFVTVVSGEWRRTQTVAVR